ncbi:MAG: hypothetical protein QXJ28_02090 [Candidatus Pacearchaeota archaeon]
MREIPIQYIRKIRQNKVELEKRLRVRISFKGRTIFLNGESEIDEYFAERVIKAMDFPFLTSDAMLLSNENYSLEIINLKDYTRRKDFRTIKGRIIGTKRKSLRTIENLSGAIIALKDNSVAIISLSDEIEYVRQAIISIIHGSKHGNVYSRLERINKRLSKDKY